MKGRCFRRDCKFVHDESAGIEDCREYRAGRCSRGDQCRFNHVDGPSVPPPPEGGYDGRGYDDDERGGERPYGEERRLDEEEEERFLPEGEMIVAHAGEGE